MDDFSAYAHPRISPNSVHNISDLAYYGNDNTKNQLIHRDQHVSRYRHTVGKYSYDYDFNQYGFRGRWNIDDNKPSIGFFGCSFTLGEYVETDKIFPTLVANQTSCNSYNFGLSGAGIERVAQVFAVANRVIDLQHAVVTLPDWNRALYLNNDDNGVQYLDLTHTTRYNKKVDQVKKTLYDLGDDYFIHQAIRNINWIIDVAERHSVKLSLAAWAKHTHWLIEQVFPTYSIGRFETHDRSLDQVHPGPGSHATYAEKIVKQLHIK